MTPLALILCQLALVAVLLPSRVAGWDIVYSTLPVGWQNADPCKYISGVSCSSKGGSSSSTTTTTTPSVPANQAPVAAPLPVVFTSANLTQSPASSYMGNVFLPASVRDSMVTLSKSDRLYLISGFSNIYPYANLNDVYMLNEHLEWKYSVADFAPRYGASGVVFQNKIILTSGYGGQYYNDVWSWTGDVTQSWSLVTASAPWRAGVYISMAVSPDQANIFLHRLETDASGNSVTVLYSSSDAANWNVFSSSSKPTARGSPILASLNQQLYMIGGALNSQSTVFTDVWQLDMSSKDWTPLSNAPFSGRGVFGYTVHQNKIFMSGGYRAYGQLKIQYNDVWSFDGVNWKCEGAGKPTPYGYLSLASIRGSLINVGGYGSDQTVWETNSLWRMRAATPVSPVGTNPDGSAAAGSNSDASAGSALSETSTSPIPSFSMPKFVGLMIGLGGGFIILIVVIVCLMLRLRKVTPVPAVSPAADDVAVKPEAVTVELKDFSRHPTPIEAGTMGHSDGTVFAPVRIALDPTVYAGGPANHV